LITELTQRGFHIGTVNHHSRAGFEIDQPGKDSWRHAQAGRRQVVIAAPDEIAIYWLLDRELTLDEIESQFKDVDIISVEGYKQAGQPSVEIVRVIWG